MFGDSTVALRLPSAAIGVATVGAFYLFCRGFIGPRAATLGSLLLGLSMWHLHYSRAALPSVLLPLAALATTYLLYQALSERRDSSRQRRLLLLAGLAFGAGAYTHNAFFIFAAAVLALWAREFLAGEQSPNEVFSKCMTFFVPALLVATPYLATLTANSGQVLEQVRTVAVSRAPEYQERQGVPDQTRYLLWNTVKTAGAVYWRREAGDGSRRLLDPVTGLLAGLGLLVGLRRWRDRWHFFLLALIVAAVVTGALTREAGTYGRMTVAMPAIFAYAGLALDGLLQLMKGRLTQVAAYAVVAAMFLFVAAFNLSSYFSHPLGVNQVLWAMATYP